MSGPLKLVTVPPLDERIRAASIELLKEAIADVEAGKVFGVIVLSKEVAGTWYHRASETISLREEIGSLEMLKFDRIARSNRDVVDE